MLGFEAQPVVSEREREREGVRGGRELEEKLRLV